MSSRRTARKKSRPITEVLGPVSDLESYVKADWWRHLFNANYLRTDGDVVEDGRITGAEVDRFVEAASPEPDTRILDVCCGQGRHALELARRGFRNVTGIDQSHYLISRARSIARKEGLTIRFREGDARRLPFKSDEFDLILLAGNSFGYFETDRDDLTVLHELRRVLSGNGQLLMDITDGEHVRTTFDPRSWEWIDRNYFVCRERCLSRDEQRLISREVITHVRKGVIADQFYAERLYSKDALLALLTETGFVEPRIEGHIDTESSRNQDLGMMARRLVVLARADKRPAATVEATRRPVSITVVQGDPSRRDVVKPNGTFDEDDLETTVRMKQALGTLNGFEFTYLDNHNSLITDLQNAATDIDLVLNLCDEGFDNRARQELHVPALLEMIGVPYTGGTPQCLAMCYDKSLVRGVAREMDIPTPRAFLIEPSRATYVDLAVAFPVIVKPNFGDSSIGITANSVCAGVEDLEAAIVSIRDRYGFDQPVLVEEYLTGADLTVGLVGNLGALRFFSVLEEDYSGLPEGLPHICGYEAKWDPTSPYWNLTSKPADLPHETIRFLQASCSHLFERLECRDYARFDWRLDANGTPRLLEVNPNPGWCWDGHLAKMAAIDGVEYADLLRLIMEAALERLRAEQRVAPRPRIG